MPPAFRHAIAAVIKKRDRATPVSIDPISSERQTPSGADADFELPPDLKARLKASEPAFTTSDGAFLRARYGGADSGSGCGPPSTAHESGPAQGANAKLSKEQLTRMESAAAAHSLLVAYPLAWQFFFPHSYTRLFLEVIGLLLVIFSVCYLPYEVGFNDPGPVVISFLGSIFSDAFFGFDMLVSFCSWHTVEEASPTFDNLSLQNPLFSHFSKTDLRAAIAVASPQPGHSKLFLLVSGTSSSSFDNLITTNWRHNILSYFRGYFIVDFFSVFPLDLLISALTNADSVPTLAALRLARAVRLLRLAKMSRLFKLGSRFKHIFGSLTGGARRLLALILSLFVIMHVSACLFHFAAVQPASGNGDLDGGATWLATVSDWPIWSGNSYTDPSSPSYVPISSRYIASMYFCTFTLLSVGYGDVHPITTTERAFALLLMLLGSSYLAFVISSTADIVTQLNSKQNQVRAKLAELAEWAADRVIPPALRLRLENYFTFSTKREIFSEEDILAELSVELRNEIILHSRNALISKVDLFKGLEPSLVTALVALMRPMNFMPGETVFCEGDTVSEVFFLTRGTVEAAVADPRPVFAAANVSLEERELVYGTSEIFTAVNNITRPVPAHSVSNSVEGNISASDSSDSDSDAVPVHETNLFPQRPLTRTSSFMFSAPSVQKEDTTLRSALYDGVTFSSPIPRGCSLYSIGIFTEGSMLGDERLFHPGVQHRSMSVFASTPCDFQVIKTEALLGLLETWGDFSARLKDAAASHSRGTFVIKKQLSNVLARSLPTQTNNLPSSAVTVHPTHFPHIADILAAQQTLFPHQIDRVLPAIYVNNSLQPLSVIPKSIFIETAALQSGHAGEPQHGVIRTVRLKLVTSADFGAVPVQRLIKCRAFLCNFFGSTRFLANADAANPQLLQEVEAVEERRDLWARGVIPPLSPLKLRWDVVLMFAVILTALEVPFVLGFDINTAPGTWINTADTIVNYLFIVDVLFSFRVPFLDDAGDGQLVTTPARIARRYLTDCFLVDLVSSIPFDSFVLSLSDAAALRSVKLVRMVRILRLTRLLRLFKSTSLLATASSWLQIRPAVTAFLALIFQVVFTAHFLACFFALCMLETTDSYPWWSPVFKKGDSADLSLGDSSLATKYLAAMYWAVATATTTGYGDIIPLSDSSRLFSIFGMVVASIVRGLIPGPCTPRTHLFTPHA